MVKLKTLFKKRIVASSLTEVIVATSILLVVFAIALVTLNNIMMSSIQKDTHQMEVTADKLIYKYKNNLLTVPLSYKEDDFVISIQKLEQDDISFVEFSVKNTITKKSIVKKQHYYEKP